MILGMSTAENQRKWRERHPEHKEYMRQWREKHADHIKEYRRNFYQANHERENDQSVFWQEEHVLETAIHRKVAAAHRIYPGRIRAKDIRDLIDRVGWMCCWCKKDIIKLRDFTLEHLQPVNDPKHLAIACHSCNCAKLPSSGLTKRMTLEERRKRYYPIKKAYDDQWKRENKGRVNDAQRARYHANIEERRAYFRQWQQKKRDRERTALQA